MSKPPDNVVELSETRSNFDSPIAKRAARRYWKRVDRAEGKRSCSDTE